MGIFVPMMSGPGAPLPWYDTWPHFFRLGSGFPNFSMALPSPPAPFSYSAPSGQTVTSQRKRSIGSFIPIAVLVPLAIPLVPRLILKALSTTFSALLSNVPYEFLGFGAFPWVLIVFLIAALQEFTLRPCLQNRLENRFGFKRACLLTALLWWLLPLGSGFGPIPGLRIAVPGLSVLVSMLVHILYNVPLAWLWSRTRSLWLVSVMHGTILLFRAGDAAHTVYFTFRWLYWIEMAEWIFITFTCSRNSRSFNLTLRSHQLRIVPNAVVTTEWKCPRLLGSYSSSAKSSEVRFSVTGNFSRMLLGPHSE